MAIPPPPASLGSKFWNAGSNFLIHLSGGWLTGSVLAKLMSRLHGGMHYSSSKHYFGDIYAQSHVDALPLSPWQRRRVAEQVEPLKTQPQRRRFCCDSKSFCDAQTPARKRALVGELMGCDDFLGEFVSRRSAELGDQT